MMLKNDYFLAKIGADTAENERNFAEKLPNISTALNQIAKAAGPQGARRADRWPQRVGVAWSLLKRKRREPRERESGTCRLATE